jgi:hypothetical protein
VSFECLRLEHWVDRPRFKTWHRRLKRLLARLKEEEAKEAKEEKKTR